VANERSKYPTGELCSGLGLARSTFYAWQTRPPSQRAMDDAVLIKEIERIHVETGAVYGSPRMFDDLVELGFRIGRKRVERLMRQQRLRARQFRRRRIPASRKASALAPNLVRRQFSVDRLNAVWVGDITELWTTEGKLYVAAVMDLCSRRIVGWTTSDRPKRTLVIEALRNALAERLPAGGLISHTDQGSQYGSIDYQRLLKRHGIRPSMSNQGTPADNAVAESFFSSLKRERTSWKRYETREEARRDLFDYIEVFYNRRRRHSHIGRISPAEFERRKNGA
jgi:putative transposase